MKAWLSVWANGEAAELPRNSELLTPGPFWLEPDGPGVSPTTQKEVSREGETDIRAGQTGS